MICACEQKERDLYMKVVAKRTVQNAYNQVLFVAGKTYDVVRSIGANTYVLNELHTETPVRSNRIGEKFEVMGDYIG